MISVRVGTALAAAGLGVMTLSGCSGDIRQQASDLVEQVVESGTEQITNAVSGDVFTPEGIDAAYAAISDKVGADPMQVVEVKIAPGVLVVEAIDPNAPTALNEWSFLAGTVRNPVPIDYAGDTEALQQNLFAINEVPATTIAAAIDGAVAASGIPDGAVKTVTVKRNLPVDPAIGILIDVEGAGGGKQVRTDVAGQVTGVV